MCQALQMKCCGFCHFTAVFMFGWFCVKKQSHRPSQAAGAEQGWQGRQARPRASENGGVRAIQRGSLLGHCDPQVSL